MVDLPDINTLRIIIKKAGNEILKIYDSENISTKIKHDKSPVTLADQRSNDILVKEISIISDYVIISEEIEVIDLNKESFWLIDPLDGTKNFIKKDGEFSIMVGFIHKKEPVLGIVYIPAKDEFYYAIKGKGSYLEINGEREILHVSNVDEFNHYRAILSKNHLKQKDLDIIARLKINNYRNIGSIGIKLGAIAKGDAEIYVNSDGLWIWDICAPQIILEEAGGEVFDKEGNSLIYDIKRFKKGIIATNSQNKRKIIRELTPV